MKPASHYDWKEGPLADAARASLRARTQEFIFDADSEPIRLFTGEERATATAGDWYGEHAGKWLVTASYGYRRTGDPELLASLRSVLERLRDAQESSGYLGTYAPDASCRFTNPEAENGRTWDLWVHAWMMLGVIQATATEIEELEEFWIIARRIGDLILSNFGPERSVVDQGNHAGLSSAIIVEPLMRIGEAGAARLIIHHLEQRGIPVRSGGVDVSQLGTGKIYQLLWLFLGMSLMGERKPVTGWWEQIRAHHLNPLGGPWGGIGGHKEVFNNPSFFDPAGMVETCSTGTWMALNFELFMSTAEAKYAAEFERSFLNALIGALDANGRDWCYFTFANGRRNNTYHWACCKSSGAMALEQAIEFAVTWDEPFVSVNLFVPSRAQGDAGEIEQDWAWDGLDFAGTIQVRNDAPLTLQIRRPDWADAVSVGDEFEEIDGYLARCLEPGEHTVSVRFTCSIKVNPYRYTIDHHGQEIVCEDYAFVSLGPLVYACGKFDGFREDETLRLAQLNPSAHFQVEGSGEFGPRLVMKLPGRVPIEFLPYAEAGGRHDHAWRRTWLQVAWQ